MGWSRQTTSIVLGSPQFVEKLARKLAAGIMGLSDDPDGARLPDDIWQQSLGFAENVTEFMGRFTFEGMRNYEVSRAAFMLSVAREYALQQPYGAVRYDDANRDAFCISDDCEAARQRLLEVFPERLLPFSKQPTIPDDEEDEV